MSPYIDSYRRAQIDAGHLAPRTAGDLTYVMYVAAVRYLGAHHDDFQTRAEILGALEACKQEFWSQKCAAYEAFKRERNSDVT